MPLVAPSGTAASLRGNAIDGTELRRQRGATLACGHPSRRPPPAGLQDEVGLCGEISDPHGEEPAKAGVSGRCSASPGEPCRPSSSDNLQLYSAACLAPASSAALTFGGDIG